MTLLESYPAVIDAAHFDELRDPSGVVRGGWASLPGLLALPVEDLQRAQEEVGRQLADHGVTYVPSPAGSVSLVDDPSPADDVLVEPSPWRLDVLPMVLEAAEWSRLEAGLAQRSAVLDAIFADLYQRRRLLSDGILPAAVVFDHDEYLRPLVGSTAGRLLLTGVDLGRAADGEWVALSDRTQAPSGAGYAMQNRRVLSRVLPAAFHEAKLARLTPFFSQVRTALADAAPQQVEDPRVVVLSPGAMSETAFDQAFLANHLGFPLVEGSDLVVRDGRVWMRVLGKLEQVDVIVRRVDSQWMDPLELYRSSRLGATGLLECVRRGTVAVVNPIGSGAVENPGLLPFLPAIAKDVLGEDLMLPSVQTWWCGDPVSRQHVETNLDRLVIRAISRNGGRSVRGGALTTAQRELLIARIHAQPHRFVGQEVLELSVSPSASETGLACSGVVLRTFTVGTADGYSVMSGGVASTTNATPESVLVTPADLGDSKDVWVVGAAPLADVSGTGTEVSDRSHAERVNSALVPRVLDHLYWLGRYAERAEDVLRLVIASAALSTDDATEREARAVVLPALSRVAYRTTNLTAGSDSEPVELQHLLASAQQRGSVARSLQQAQDAAQEVRDQLSGDVWMIFATVDRARRSLLRLPNPSWSHLVSASERMLTGLLGLAGIVAENMVRDPGWYLLDSGRGVERALQVLRLLEVTVCQARSREVDRLVIDSVLTAAESIVTYRRRQRGRVRVDALIDLLVVDVDNPRSVAYQLHRIQSDLLRMPNASLSVAPVRAVSDLLASVRDLDPVSLARSEGGERAELRTTLVDLQAELRAVSDLIHLQWQQLPPTPRFLPPQRSGFGPGVTA